MKIELPDTTRSKLEEFFVALVEYQLEGRLMIFQGLCSHMEMIGAINITQSIIGYQRGIDLIEEVTARPKTEAWKHSKGWKFEDLNAAYRELTNPEHRCFYCEKVPRPNDTKRLNCLLRGHANMATEHFAISITCGEAWSKSVNLEEELRKAIDKAMEAKSR